MVDKGRVDVFFWDVYFFKYSSLPLLTLYVAYSTFKF